MLSLNELVLKGLETELFTLLIPGITKTKYTANFDHYVGPITNYREILILNDSSETCFYPRVHYRKIKNVVAYYRVFGDIPNLHVEEIQSDWGQDARLYGFKPEHYHKTISDYDERIKALRKDISTNHDELKEVQERKKNFLDENRNKVDYLFCISKTKHWTDIVLENITKRAIIEGYSKVTFTPGAIHAERYATPSLAHYYDKILPKRALRLRRTFPVDVKNYPLIISVL